MTTPEQALEIIHDRFGAHDGHRALHAKGVLCTGSFTATPAASGLTRAGHMSGRPVETTVRFSNGGGNPRVPDYAPDVRGLAVSFHLSDGSRTDILAQTIERFPFSDQEGFLDLLKVTKPSFSSLVRLPFFLLRNPRAALDFPSARRVTAALPASFACRRYIPFHAFKWIDAGGGERWVRYTWHPGAGQSDISQAEARERGRDYLFDELRDRLRREPVRMTLEVQIAEEGDDPHDPSSVWPDERERVTVGTLEVTAIDEDADDAIVFDPMRLTDGIEPSDDPVLRFRPKVYTLSHEQRLS